MTNNALLARDPFCPLYLGIVLLNCISLSDDDSITREYAPWSVVYIWGAESLSFIFITTLGGSAIYTQTASSDTCKRPSLLVLPLSSSQVQPSKAFPPPLRHGIYQPGMAHGPTSLASIAARGNLGHFV